MKPSKLGKTIIIPQFLITEYYFQLFRTLDKAKLVIQQPAAIVRKVKQILRRMINHILIFHIRLIYRFKRKNFVMPCEFFF